MEPTTLTVTINVNGLERTFQGEYHELHSRNWDERVHDMLDTVNEAEQERNIDHANDNRIWVNLITHGVVSVMWQKGQPPHSMKQESRSENI